jgi:hypothetical protein
MKKKARFEVMILVTLALAAGLIWFFDYYSPAAGTPAAILAAGYTPLAVENSQIHWGRLEETKATEYKPGPRDIFNSSLPPPPPVEVRIPKLGDNDYVAPVIPPPPPLQLPLKYFGYGTVESGTERRAFLTDSDTVFIVGEGDNILGRYRVIRITRTNLEFEEIATGRRGTASLEDQGPGGQ